MKKLFLKNLRSSAPGVLILLAFDLVLDLILGESDPMFAVFIMNIACLMIAQNSKEMTVESSWPVERSACVDVRYVMMLITMALFSLKTALTAGEEGLPAISIGLFIVSLSAGTAFPFVIAGKNFASGLIAGASSALIIILMDSLTSVSVPWYAFLLAAVAAFMTSRLIAMRIWMKGGSAR